MRERGLNKSVTWRVRRGCPHPARVIRRQHMLIRTRRGWELPESAASNEAVFHDRRRLLQGLAAGPILAATGFGNGVAWAADADPSAALYPAKRNERYVLDRPVTAEKYPTTY